MVSQKLLQELKIILYEDYGKDLPIEDVAKIANNLVGYFDLLGKIYHRNQTQYANAN